MIICSRNWIIIWIRFELNTLFFLPFLKNSYYLFFSERIIKYFIIQRICSIGLILSWLIFLKNSLIIIFILLKIGLPPFHWWVIDFLKINNWLNFYYLITIQKIRLFIISFYFIFEKIIFLMFIILSIIIRRVIIYFFNNLINILLFSSIIHRSWLFSSLFFSFKLWFIYFIFYILILFILVVFLKNSNYFYFSQWQSSIKWGLFFILIGLPPFSIFIIKWRISIFIIKWRISIFIIFLSISFLSLYIYFKFVYLRFLVKYSIFINLSFVNKNVFIIFMEIIIFYIIIIF